MTQYLSYTDFIADVSIRHEKLFRLFGWRYGQTYFNMLAQAKIDVANMIRGTDLDPFMSEEVTELQHKIIEGIWNDRR
jgi:hypothetical protein